MKNGEWRVESREQRAGSREQRARSREQEADMVGEERTPLLAGQVQKQELQGHGLQGHGQVGSQGQEREVARSWLPWTALALAVLAGVSAGLQVV